MDRPSPSPQHQQIPMTRGNSAGITKHMEVHRLMVTKRRFAVMALSALMVIGSTSITLANEPSMNLLGNPPASGPCTGTDNFALAGTTTFGSPDGPTHVEFTNWDPSVDVDDYETILPAGSWTNAYNLSGWVFVFGSTDCTVDLVYTDHVTRHINDRTANEGKQLEFVDFASAAWVQQLFTPAATVPDLGTACGDAANPCTGTPGSDPATPDSNGVITSGGFGDEDYEGSETTTDSIQVSLDGSDPTMLGTPDADLCADEFAGELSETLGVDRNNRDACNPYAGVEDRCVIGYLRKPLDRHPELSSSGAGNIFTVRRQGQTFISWFPHGRATFQPGPTGRIWEAGIFCTYDQIMGWINQNMARVGATEYVDWQELRFLNLDTYNIPGGYYGGTEDPDTAKDCRPQGEERIFEQIRKGYIEAPGYYVHGSPWVSGVSKERQVVIGPLKDGQELHWDSNVQGAVRLYSAERCDFEDVLEQARVHHNARGKAHSVKVVRNWRDDPYTSAWFQVR